MQNLTLIYLNIYLVLRSPVSLLHLLSIYSHILLSTTQIDHSKRKLQSSVEPFYYANQTSEIGGETTEQPLILTFVREFQLVCSS